MNFGEQIKNLRKDKKLTQQEMADRLNVSRQAVSNWENDKNLPDIEMLITMSQVFHLTLDELILGGAQKNNMTEKLIRDTGETAQRRMNLTGIKLGCALLALSFVSLVLAVWVPVGMENSFALAFSGLMLGGILTFMLVGLKNVVDMVTKRSHDSFRAKLAALGGVLVLAGMILYVSSLATGMLSPTIGFAGIAAGILLVVIAAAAGGPGPKT